MIRNFIQRFFLADKKSLARDWVKIKALIDFEIQSLNFERAITLTEKACHLAYIYNFVPNYWDSEIEGFIQKITKAVTNVKPDNAIAPNNRVVFFDHFVLENRGFTQQYLEALINNGAEIVYIVDRPEYYSKQNQIIQTVEQYEKGSVAVLSNPTRIGRITELLEVITQFNPSKVLVHSAPWEIVSSCVALALQKNTAIKCYLLNITDHAFWPGITCFEFIIDFRSYGYNINRLLKGKSSDKLIVIPTPPYLKGEEPFNGFPDIPNNCTIGFAGGGYYKIVDRQNTFLNLIKTLILQNENFIFLFACIGGEEELRRFISENALEKRFLLIGNRKDIAQVFKRIDIFFNTYPYGGGLMLQYAISNKKPIVSLWDSRLYHTRLDFVFDTEFSQDHIIVDHEKYIEIASKLINNGEYRASFTRHYDEIGDAVLGFDKRVRQLLNNETVDLGAHYAFAINQNGVTDFHIEGENIRRMIYTARIYNIFHYKPIFTRLGIFTRYLLYRIAEVFNVA